MPRLSQVSRADAPTPLVTQMYDLLFGERDPVAEPGTETGTPGDWWTVFANVPDVFEHAVRGFGVYRSPERRLDPVLRELGQTRVGYAAQSQFVFSTHCKSLRGLGVSEERIAAVAHWPAASCFSEIERLVLAYTDCLAYDHGRVPDGLFDALRTLDEQGVELIYAEGFEGENAAAYMDRLTHASVKSEDKSEETEARQVLFVCQGNTCRSTMAEALFNDRYGDTGWRAISAGLSTIPGWPVSEHSVEALREFGIDCRGMTSKPVNRRMLSQASLVVTMTTLQREWLRRSAPELKDKIISVADISEQSQDIADPFGETLISYRQVRDELSEIMDDLHRFLQQSDHL